MQPGASAAPGQPPRPNHFYYRSLENHYLHCILNTWSIKYDTYIQFESRFLKISRKFNSVGSLIISLRAQQRIVLELKFFRNAAFRAFFFFCLLFVFVFFCGCGKNRLRKLKPATHLAILYADRGSPIGCARCSD